MGWDGLEHIRNGRAVSIVWIMISLFFLSLKPIHGWDSSFEFLLSNFFSSFTIVLNKVIIPNFYFSLLPIPHVVISCTFYEMTGKEGSWGDFVLFILFFPSFFSFFFLFFFSFSYYHTHTVAEIVKIVFWIPLFLFFFFSISFVVKPFLYSLFDFLFSRYPYAPFYLALLS
ncbi:hypothetical protein L873DRAFT_871188 [Choiromyces venosus 120613-1]|uniref:Uncharacterized protein n=1 Tax=Choiromyces venosus 120613-1 TaxID=1336337 RepID=A0A3N4JRM3_9PEZI|nr:hypothetical protein L873DRAFT_871188 [Choiromyces venosus 120613-1]